MVQRSVERMSSLIDNWLDFARGRLGGGLTQHLDASKPLQPVLNQVIAELRASWPDRAIDEHLSLAEPVNVTAAVLLSFFQTSSPTPRRIGPCTNRSGSSTSTPGARDPGEQRQHERPGAGHRTRPARQSLGPPTGADRRQLRRPRHGRHPGDPRRPRTAAPQPAANTKARFCAKTSACCVPGTASSASQKASRGACSRSPFSHARVRAVPRCALNEPDFPSLGSRPRRAGASCGVG